MEKLPIRAIPYAHQIEAYYFACQIFGLNMGGEDNGEKRKEDLHDLESDTEAKE